MTAYEALQMIDRLKPDLILSKPVAPAERVRAVLTLCGSALHKPVPEPKRV